MPKINNKTIFKFERIPVRVFQFDNSKNYFDLPQLDFSPTVSYSGENA